MSSARSRFVALMTRKSLRMACVAPALPVDRLRDELLARARFAEDEHRRVGLGDLCDLLQYRQEPRAPADDLLEIVRADDALAQPRVLPPEAPALDGVRG